MTPIRNAQSLLAVVLSTLLVSPPPALAASHREAPITALDHQADITDVFAFVSYDKPDHVTLILNTNGFLDPANGPNYFPFDPDITYTIHVDNDQDAVEEVSFEFHFTTHIGLPSVFTGFLGAGNGIPVPSDAPTGGAAPGTTLIPPAITSLTGPGATGLSLSQTYTVTMVTGSGSSATRTDMTGGATLSAVPSNVGPRTMPNYPALAQQGIYSLPNNVRVWAGTADDPFYIDVGSIFDTVNLRPTAFGSGVPGVLTAAQDASSQNTAPDALAGFNVNVIAIEVPITMLTSDGAKHPATDPQATIGVWGTTARPSVTVRTAPGGTPVATAPAANPPVQIQRMGNPLINELIIGTGDKDNWSMSLPSADSQFAHYALDPLLARALNAAYGGALQVPPPPRNDLLLLVQYLPPIASANTPKGPVADLLRLNTGVPPTPMASRSRLGVVGGDLAGWPNGRRVSDDVTDIALRAVAGVLVPGFTGAPNNALGDGVNSNDVPYQETFPYVAWAHSGLAVPNGGTFAPAPQSSGSGSPTPPTTGSAPTIALKIGTAGATAMSGTTTQVFENSILLDASGSTDPNNLPLTYSFSSTPAVNFVGGANSATPTVVFPGRGTYVITVTVTDSAGLSSTMTLTLSYSGH